MAHGNKVIVDENVVGRSTVSAVKESVSGGVFVDENVVGISTAPSPAPSPEPAKEAAAFKSVIISEACAGYGPISAVTTNSKPEERFDINFTR